MTGRLVGAGILLLATTLLAHLLGRDIRAEVALTEAYLTLLRRLRHQIAAYSRPPGECLRRLEPELLAACGLSPADDPLADLRSGAERLPDDAARVVQALCAELGRGYLEEQLALFDGALGELGAIVERAQKRLPERLRLIRCACICGGLAIILLFL